MNSRTLPEWLEYLGCVHRTNIELGLDRVKEVAGRLHLLPEQNSNSCLTIIVGGTNGKGSTVAGLSAIYQAAGFQAGSFTSPYLFKHNEEVKINDEMASDEDFCDAFAMIEKARATITLTPFEFHTLAALIIFKKSPKPLDVMILEVGLGGRKDAVNIMDADLAIIASIDIDHVDYLGNTRESIGHEKSGIFRANQPAICGDFNPPTTLLAQAQTLNVPLYCQGKDFYFKQNEENSEDWSWHHQQTTVENLPMNGLAIQNMSTVIMAATLLQKKLPVDTVTIKHALKHLNLPGRIQVVQNNKLPCIIIFDVAHNPAACAYLAKRLQAMNITGTVRAVFSMLTDKDIPASIFPLRDIIDEWYFAALQTTRAASCETLQNSLQENGIAKNHLQRFPSIVDAYQCAQSAAQSHDAIIVFGSFHTVSACAHH